MAALAGDVGDTISEIMGRMTNFLPFFRHGTVNSIAEDINQHLLRIKEAVTANLDKDDDTSRRVWLGKVTDVVTSLFDLVDNLSDDAAHQKPGMIRSLFSPCNLTPQPQRAVLELKGIEKRLRDVAAGADAAKLSPKNAEKLTNSDAKEQETKIVGREYEREKIIKQILPEKKVVGDVQMVTIVGIEGIGKTKLAKVIFDDEKVKSEFNLMIWIDDMPADDDKSYAEWVVNRMIGSAMKRLEDEDSTVMDQPANLQAVMSGSRFLLVLDDLRNENSEEWLKLQQMLREAASPTGGAVIVTTQSDIVAEIFETGSGTWQLTGLFMKDSCSLFKQIAGVSEITDAQKQMVRKCRGVPAAIITVARLLSSREATTTESEIQKLKKEFLQELQLRYYDGLPCWRVKQCFAYSSFIFSRHYDKVNTQKLIRLWMAEGFLGPANSSSPRDREPEDLGHEFIEEFRRRSIFCASKKEYHVWKEVTMSNNLMRDLSAFVAGHDSFFFMDDPDKDVKQKVCRVSLDFGLDVSNGIPKSLFKTNKILRTFHFRAPSYRWDSRVPFEVKLSWSACDAIFSGFKRLRVLTLQDLGMKMMPGSIGELKSLRYLDLSHNNMKKLPNSIGELKHLQTLKLSHCHELRELPDVKELVSLRHLEIEECLNLTHMPSALKNLTSLWTLTNFVARISKDQSHTGGLRELTNLNNLRGKLELLHLERLKFKESNQDKPLAYLEEKRYLQCLTLRWNHDEEDDDEDINSDEGHKDQNTWRHSLDHDKISLRHLQPHPNLQALSIVGYQGLEFSKWLSSLENLVEFSLYNCSKCKSLPPLDQLPKLKILKLQRLDYLDFIADQDDSSDGGNIVCNELGSPAATKRFFQSLKELTISDCPNLTSWWKGRTANNTAIKASLFPSISSLEIQHCPKLDCMPLYPNLDDKLVLVRFNVKPLQETLNYRASTSGTAWDSDSSPPLSKVKSLTIANVEEQSPLPEEWLKNFSSLSYLRIKKCNGLKSRMKGFKHLNSLDFLWIRDCTEIDLPSDEWKGLKKLTSLYIEDIPELKSLPEGIKHLTSLGRLDIESCPELTTLTDGIGDLKSLGYLSISECHKLESLPQGMSNLKSLCWLRITNCTLLLPRCQTETGDDWEKIKHISSIDVKDTSQYYD